MVSIADISWFLKRRIVPWILWTVVVLLLLPILIISLSIVSIGTALVLLGHGGLRICRTISASLDNFDGES